MKRVSVVAQGLNDGGAERVASLLANYFANQGYQVQFIAAYNKEREYYLSDKIELCFVETNSNNKGVRFFQRNKQIYSYLK